jgi:hypothetical protein
MTDEDLRQIRLECIRIAERIYLAEVGDRPSVLELAESFVQFVVNGEVES